jgi:hypothetical protein
MELNSVAPVGFLLADDKVIEGYKPISTVSISPPSAAP